MGSADQADVILVIEFLHNIATEQIPCSSRA